MSKRITDDQSKIDLVARLVKDGAIDFVEAMKLLEVETEVSFMPTPVNHPHNPFDVVPRVTPLTPIWWGGRSNEFCEPPYKITC